MFFYKRTLAVNSEVRKPPDVWGLFYIHFFLEGSFQQILKKYLTWSWRWKWCL